MQGRILTLLFLLGAVLKGHWAWSQPLIAEEDNMVIETFFEENGTYFGNLALRVNALPPKAKAVSVNFFFKELVRVGQPQIKVDRGQIKLTNTSLNLTPDRWTNLRLSIKEVVLPGTYEGAFILSYTFNKQIYEKEIPVHLELLDDRQPALGEGAPKTLQLVATSSWLDRFFPNSGSPDTLAIPIDNPSTLPLQVNSYTVKLAHSTRAGAYLDKNDFVLTDRAWSLPGEKEGLLKIVQQASSLIPGVYEGEVTLFFADATKNPVRIPLTVNVKGGITLAILVLIFGILAGRVLKSVNSAASALQMKLMQQKLETGGEIRSLDDAEARARLLVALKGLETDIDAIQSAEDAKPVEEALALIDQQARFIFRLEKYRDELNRQIKTKQAQNLLPDKKVGAAFNKRWEDIREMVLDQKLTEAKSAWIEMVEIAGNLFPKAKGVQEQADRGLAKWLNDKPELNFQAHQVPPPDDTPASKSIWQQSGDFLFRVGSWIFRTLFGLATPSARVRFWFLRPLVVVITYIGILLIGLEAIYFQGGANFGVNGIYDYMKLFIWGVSSDVFSRTFGDFAMTKGNTGSFKV